MIANISLESKDQHMIALWCIDKEILGKLLYLVGRYRKWTQPSKYIHILLKRLSTLMTYIIILFLLNRNQNIKCLKVFLPNFLFTLFHYGIISVFSIQINTQEKHIFIFILEPICGNKISTSISPLTCNSLLQ